MTIPPGRAQPPSHPCLWQGAKDIPSVKALSKEVRSKGRVPLFFLPSVDLRRLTASVLK